MGGHTQEPKPQLIIMNPMYTAALAVMALASVAQTTIILGTGVTTIGTAGTLTLGSTMGGLLLGGAIILKGLVLGTALRSKRSADAQTQDAAFTVLNTSEPAQCYRRLICDLAAGAIPDKDNIVSLFNAPVSPKFEYATAAKVGKLVKKAGLCELRYSCPLS